MNTLREMLAKDMDVVFNFLKEDAVNLTLEILFNIMMKAEREEFLNEERANGIRNKGNGYYTRFIKLIQHHFRVNIPRDRNGIFKPMLLEILKKNEETQLELFHSMYLAGMSTHKISKVLQKVYGYKISASTISNITKRYEQSMNEWLRRPLREEYYFLYIDAINVKVRRETVDTESVYIVLGVKRDLKREILGIYTFPQESKEGWRAVIRDIKKRGMRRALGVISDELTGLHEVISQELKGTRHQICLVHKYRNMLKILRQKDRDVFKLEWDEVFLKDHYEKEETKEGGEILKPYAKSEAIRRLKALIDKWSAKYRGIRNAFKINPLEVYVQYLEYPIGIQRMVYTTNWIENLNKQIRSTLKVRGALPNIDSAMNLIGQSLQAYEEEKLQIYGVTSFIAVQEELDFMLEQQRRRYEDEWVKQNE